MELEQPSVEGFVAFVARQPAEQRIDHSTWESCAVGDYLEECTTLSRYEAACWAAVLPFELHELLNTRGRHFDNRYPVETYGDVAEFIEKFHPELIA